MSDVTELGSVEYQPTNADISAQVGALSAHMNQVHREVALNREETSLGRAETASVRADLATLSSYVMRDQSPRLTAVEKTLGSKVGNGAACAAKWFTVVSGSIAVAVQIASMLRPDLVGPLESLQKIFTQAP